jgi:large subunit ribosomal protein L35
MPKMKTHRGAAARVKVTGTGRLRRRQQMRGHLLEKKSSVRTRRLSREVDFAPGDKKRIKRLIGM